MFRYPKENYRGGALFMFVRGPTFKFIIPFLKVAIFLREESHAPNYWLVFRLIPPNDTI
jgi:hypothetical protein